VEGKGRRSNTEPSHEMRAAQGYLTDGYLSTPRHVVDSPFYQNKQWTSYPESETISERKMSQN
jgi:hypothetical protein